MRRLVVLPTLILLSVAPSVSHAEGDTPADLDDVVDQPVAPHTATVWIDPETDLASDVDPYNHHISNIIYVNRCTGGCIITPGENDARANTSSIPKNGTAQISEFMHPQQVFDDTIACLKEVYGPYNVQIVTEDPGPEMFHHEAILAGTPQEVGWSSQTLGVAPSYCTPLDNVISFSFANAPAMGSDPLTMCHTVAQESAHSFGLPSHVFDCSDPMTYIEGCGQKFFRDKAFPCGEFALGDVPCACGATVQNSHRELNATFGPGTPPPSPVVDILLPADNAAVTDGFAVFATATDKRLVDHIELWINGTRYDDKEGHDYFNRNNDYSFVSPNLPDGIMTVEIKAYNDLAPFSEPGVASITVTKGEPCTTNDQCFDGQSCDAGACKYPPATAGMGDMCARDTDCLEGFCSPTEGERYCTVSCNPNVQDACTEGFECLSAGICWPAGAGGGGGCCSVAGGNRHGELPLVAFGLFLGAILALRRRRG